MSSTSQDITTLLARWRAGDQQAGDRIMERIYEEMRAVAGNLFQGVRADHTLQPTALAHEAYIRIIEDGKALDARDRHHLFALISRICRQVIVDHARERGRLKRGGGQIRVELDDGLMDTPMPYHPHLLDLDRALQRLAEKDETAARIIEMRFFAGMTASEITGALNISPTTVNRKWVFAKSWLHEEIFST